MGSMLYSHVEKSGELGESIFRDSDGLQWIGMLDIRYPAGFVGASHGARTWMTLTWDPSMWTDEEAVSFLALYESLLDDLAEELDT